MTIRSNDHPIGRPSDPCHYWMFERSVCFQSNGNPIGGPSDPQTHVCPLCPSIE
ncbi:hypothetical protein Hanom_Chr10g00927351 [Helianthus anomalus]